MDIDPSNKTCSFCGVQGTSETVFAGGLGAMMCWDCVSFFYTKLGTAQGRSSILLRAKPVLPWDELSDTELLAKLPMIAATNNQASAFLRDWVQLARERGLSWTEIGHALGVSRQAVWERFAKSRAGSNSASA